ILCTITLMSIQAASLQHSGCLPAILAEGLNLYLTLAKTSHNQWRIYLLLRFKYSSSLCKSLNKSNSIAKGWSI
ncbi:hypothetical protein, partial [Erwinia amylovora]|uniref:hypothetical protein n=1 Tax=Erwinia amylovora TaxID=552 RepID=UPI001966CE2D